MEHGAERLSTAPTRSDKYIDALQKSPGGNVLEDMFDKEVADMVGVMDQELNEMLEDSTQIGPMGEFRTAGEGAYYVAFGLMRVVRGNSGER